MTDELYGTVAKAVYWLDSRNGRGPHELTARILKIGEEFGEAAQAWIGHLGQNPRKGHTHTTGQVADELADVVITALVAMRSLQCHPGPVLAAKARELARRIEADTSPVWAGCGQHPDRLSGRDCPDCTTHGAALAAGDYGLVCAACHEPITGPHTSSGDDLCHLECTDPDADS